MAFPPNKNESAPVFEAGGGDSVMENNRRRTDTGDREIASGEVGVVSEMCSYSRSGRRMFPSKRLSDFGDLSKGFGNKEFKAEEGEGGRKSKRRKVERCEEMNLRDDLDLGVERCEGMNLRDDSDLGADKETRSNRKGKSGDGEKRSNRKGKSGDGEMGKVGSRCDCDDQKNKEQSVEEVGVSREKGKVGSRCNSDDQKDRGKSVEEVGVSREKGKVGSRCNSDDQKDRGKSVEEVGVSREKGKVGSRCNSDDQKDRGKSVEEVGVSREMCSYSRSGRRLLPSKKLLDYDGLIKKEEFEVEEGEGEGGRKSKRRKVEHRVGINLGDDDSADVGGLSRDQERSSKWDRSESKEVGDGELRRKLKKSECSAATKREWTRLSIHGDAEKFIGFNCKVYWPADDSWYKGHIVGYNPETDRHHVKYCDGDEEHLVLSKVKISFFVSPEEIQFLGLSSGIQCSDTDSINKEVVDLAATLGDSGPLVPGDIVWAKVAGHPRWPAIVLDESACLGITGLDKISGEKTVLVQFFGTYEFARVRMNEITRFLKGLLRDLRSMCKKKDFYRSLEEAKTYICKTELPNVMLSVRKQNTDNCATVTGEGVNNNEGTRVEENRKKLEDLRSCPFKIGDLQIISLGKIVEDSDCFLDYNYICPEGYTALRNFPSISDPNKCISYKMEVLRDDNALNKPLFRVTSENGAQFEGPTSSSCWDKINRKIRKVQLSGSAALKASGGLKKVNRSGPEMFGFSHPEILKLIQLSSTPKEKLELPMMESKDLPLEYRSVLVTWKDIDKCNVCHMEEECENNLLLQCDKCRMMVHSRCYGEQEPVDGILWYCNLCRMGASEYPPPCCLCPVKGGAMKPTTDGRWAHLACAIWIPETCLIDYKKMEPVDGLNRIKKDRWKLLCSICGVSYGACIQCSNSSCYVAYHPLCARVAGFCLEPEGEERRRLILREEDEYNQCIHLLSFCQRHKVPSNGRTVVGRTYQQLKYTPPPNPSGCARTEPYDYLGRKGIKEPEAHGSASLKRLYIENRPHLVGGCSQHDSSRKLLLSQCDTPRNFSSMAEKYNHMSRTFKRRLAFGKSRIHGFGVFAKEPHLAGDMVIEYIGQVIRPPVADRREYLMYNSSVGAGTYMFRIDNERVIDATKAGSIAHLINHSCEPNCYSRIITVNGDEHIIIFAKRDIKQWEELTYDYRFFSDDEQLACYCGFPSCRGVVNYIGPHEPIVKQCVPISDLTVETRTSDCRLGSEQLENLNN